MRIACIVKRVPDSRATLTVGPDGREIDAGGLKFVCDPFDEFGVAEAVQLRRERGDVDEIVVIAAGPAETIEALRYCLAMGADRAVHVSGDAIDLHDEPALARLLGAALDRIGGGFDLVLCGKQAIDNDAGELGPALAEHLDLPHVGAVTRLGGCERGLRAHRRIEGAEEIVEASLPLLVTCEKGLIEPRHPALPRLLKAKKLPIETVAAGDLGAAGAAAGPVLERLAPPPPRSACRMIDGGVEQMARELVRMLREDAKVI